MPRWLSRRKLSERVVLLLIGGATMTVLAIFLKIAPAVGSWRSSVRGSRSRVRAPRGQAAGWSTDVQSATAWKPGAVAPPQSHSRPRKTAYAVP